MARGQSHSKETKAACMAALLAGQGVNEVARHYTLNEATVRNWKRSLDPQKLTEVNEKKREEFGELLASYMRANISALIAQAKMASDEKYLRLQPASELATLHGVMADKGIRLLEAAQAGSDSEEAELP